MPKYHFHYRHERELTPDDAGLCFATFEEAYLAAFEGARDMWLELLRERRDPRRSSFEVCDEEGQILFILPFAEVLDSCVSNRAGNGRTQPFRAILDGELRVRRGFAGLQDELRKAQDTVREARDVLSRAEAFAPEAGSQNQPAKDKAYEK